jgi:integrase
MTTARLERFITKRQNEGMNINTLRKILVTLGQILSYAVRHKYLDQNPLREVERPRNPGEEKKELTILTPEQLRAFLEAEEDQKYKTLFLVAVMTGARQGELLGLKWGDLDLINSQIHIQRTFTKGQFFPTKTRDSKRKIDLSPAVMLELKKWKLACPKNDLDLIFPNEAGEPMNYSNMVQRHFLPALEKAGIIEIEKIKNKPKDPKKYKKAFRKTKGMKVRFHDLRHGFASLLIEQGENIKYIQAMLGHSSPMVTLNVYAHLMKPTNQEAVLKLENAILGCDGSKNGSRAGLETKKELTS